MHGGWLPWAPQSALNKQLNWVRPQQANNKRKQRQVSWTRRSQEKGWKMSRTMNSAPEFEDIKQREAFRDVRRQLAACLHLPGPIRKEFRSLALIYLHIPSARPHKSG